MRTLRVHQREAVDIMKVNQRGVINLPTGSGKSLIQSQYIVEDIQEHRLSTVYVICAPTILLSNQLLSDIKQELTERHIDCQYLCVHSGNSKELEDLHNPNLPFREINATTSSSKICDDYERAQRELVPLIIAATYDSLERINLAHLPVRAILCDEAHNLVTSEFQNYTTQLLGDNMFFFTATLKETSSDDGHGMNNVQRFGEILYQKSPAEMILAGEIVRPRLHIVQTSVPIVNHSAIDPKAIIESFKEHAACLNTGAKMLVVCKGQEHLNNILQHPELVRFRRIRPNLTIFDITSDSGARINDIKVSRKDFLQRLKELKDGDEAIVFHVEILGEGIDVPGITGVMFLDNIKISKFLQNLGRATRLHHVDRRNLYNGDITPQNLEDFTKPYAYIICPQYGLIGEDLTVSINNTVRNLRDYGFNPTEDIVIKNPKGSKLPVPLPELNDLNTRNLITEIVADITHDIEEEESAKQITNLIFKTDNLDALVSNLEVLSSSFNQQLEYLSSKEMFKFLGKDIIRTPFKLISEIVNKLPDELFKDSNSKFLDPVMGSGMFLLIIKNKLLEFGHDEKHIVENMLYGSDIYNENVEFVEKILGLNKFKCNLMQKDSLKEELFPGVKFDCVVGNPPYKRGMHLEIMHKGLEILSDTGKMVMIQPATWLQNQIAGAKIQKYRTLFGPFLKSIKLINGDEAFPSTELGMLISITTLDKTHKGNIEVNDSTTNSLYEVSSINDIHKFGEEGNSISLKILSQMKKSLKDYLNVKDSNSQCYLTLPTIWGSMGDGTYDDNFFSFFGVGGENGDKNNIRTSLPETSTRFFSFETLEEAENFKSYLKTYFARFCLSIAKFDRSINPITLTTTPYLDFKTNWTDELLFEKFNITKQEQEFIFKHIPKYY